MGICYNNKSIEQIIHLKYTLAQQAKPQSVKSQYNHIYLWKYNADDLSEKDVLFFETERMQQWNSQKNTKFNRQFMPKQQSLMGKSYKLTKGQPLKWPFKVHSDQGYIVLTIKNKKKYLEQLSSKQSQANNKRKGQTEQQKYSSKVNEFAQKKVSFQLLESLFMIHLDSFKSYYFTQIKDQNPQFQASIQIIIGDLLERSDSLKLVSISYQLQKYIKLGGHNILKKFYNQFENISYLNSLNNAQNHQVNINFNSNKFSKITKKNSNGTGQEFDIKSEIQSINQFSNQLPIINILSEDFNRIKTSALYDNQKERQDKIKEQIKDLFLKIYLFQVFRTTILSDFDELKNYIQYRKRSATKATYFKNRTQAIIKKCKQLIPASQLQKQKIINSQINHQNLHPNQTKNTKNRSNELQQKDFPNIDIQMNDISIIQKPSAFNNKTSQKNNELDTSSPFMCQITQIYGSQSNKFDIQNNLAAKNQFSKKEFQKQKQEIKFLGKTDRVLIANGQIQESLFLPKQLQQLRIDRNIYAILTQSQTQCPLMISTYFGSSNYNDLLKNNVSLIINLSPNQCYNYFLQDIKYEWVYVEPIHTLFRQQELFSADLDQLKQDNLYLYNIQCLIFNIIDKINTESQNDKDEEQQEILNKVCIFCNHKNMIYSGTIAVAYLMFSNKYRFSFDVAYKIVQSSLKSKFIIPKIYQKQLKCLSQRIQSSCPAFQINELNAKSSSYRTYQVGLYSIKDSTFIVPRYIGQILSSNQLQLLQNYAIKSYLLIPNNITSILIKSLTVLREDNSIANISKMIKNMGLNLRIFFGKEVPNSNKQNFAKITKQLLLPQIIRFQYLNFNKKIFNIDKYKSRIQLIIQALKELLTIQSIQKSFRKPQPIEQIQLSNVTNYQLLKTNLLLDTNLRIQPFNTKQTLIFKYPILRPIFQSKKKDGYYFMIKKSYDDNKNKKGNGIGCNVSYYKGQDWIGLEQDKQRYFEKIVEVYLKDVSQQKIWIEDNQQSGMQKSLFDGDSLMF